MSMTDLIAKAEAALVGVTGPQIMYVCEYCAEHCPEGCGNYDAENVRLSPSGAWLCEYCYDENPPKGEIEDQPLWCELPKAPDLIALARAQEALIEELVGHLEYARRFLKPIDHDTESIDATLAKLKGGA